MQDNVRSLAYGSSADRGRKRMRTSAESSHPDRLPNPESAPSPGPASVSSPSPSLQEPEESGETTRLETPGGMAAFSELVAVMNEILPVEPPGFKELTNDANQIVLNLGDDRIIFILPSDDPTRDYLNNIENRPLRAPPSFVEVKRSRLGGFGLFTTKKCSQGELMHTERPLVRASDFCQPNNHVDLARFVYAAGVPTRLFSQFHLSLGSFPPPLYSKNAHQVPPSR
jgi:hypothetical protein